MGDMGIGAAYGAQGAADALREIIKDRIAAQQRAQDLQQQTFTNNRLTANDARLAEEHTANMEDRRAAQQAAAEDRNIGRANTLGDQIPAGTEMAPTDQGVGMMQGGGRGSLLRGNMTLPSTQMSGGMTLPDDSGGQIRGTLRAIQSPEALRSYTKLASEKQNVDAAKSALEAAQARKDLQPKDPTGADEDRRFERIDAAQRLKQPVSPEDMAWSQAYAKRKTLGPVASSGFADARLSKTEDFAEAQVGRKELTDKVEKPYQDAVAQAATLRDIVTAAKAGNKFAAAQQPLEATLATVRQAGLSRINANELGVSANAGSLWDRIQGAMGKQTAGQPMDPELQQNLLDYAGLLEKAAHKRYLEGHKAITTRYKLTDEKPMGGASDAVKADPLGIR